MNTIMKNLAIIGIGKWGQNLTRDMKKFANIKICSSSGNKKNIDWMKNNYPSVKHTRTTEKIFSDNEIDAVVIATPIKTHYHFVKKALLSKKHVFVEKPLASNLTHVNELIKLAKKNKLNLFVGHIFIYNEIFNKIIQINKNENIRTIHFQWNKYGTFDEDIFLNLLSHELSLLLFLFGKPTKIQLQNNVGIITKSDLINLNLKFNKKYATIMINRFSSDRKKTVVIKTSKNSYVWDNDQLFKQNNNKQKLELIYKSKNTPLENECETFVKSLSNSKISYDSANLAKDVIQVLKKINKK